jgi:hypothetical protein
MCGIAGEIRLDGGIPDVAAVARITEAMHRRGPDGTGVHAAGPTALGHRRLKIIDLSERGGQPMVDAELGLAAVFNGCIYNYRELRAELEGAGYRFFSTSDTEVLLKAFHRWGAACVERFYGMFAFAVAERDTGVLTLGRDRLGIKPLYLAETPQRIRFASALPALLEGGGVDTSIDRVALHHYMTFHSVVPRRARSSPGCASSRPPPCARSAPTAPARSTSTGGPSTCAGAVRRHERARLARRGARVAAGRGAPPHGRRRARRGAALGRARLVAGRGAARGRGPGRAQDVQRGLPRHGGRERRRVRVLRTSSPSTSAPTTSRSSSTPTGCCPPSTPPSPR